MLLGGFIGVYVGKCLSTFRATWRLSLVQPWRHDVGLVVAPEGGNGSPSWTRIELSAYPPELDFEQMLTTIRHSAASA